MGRRPGDKNLKSFSERMISASLASAPFARSQENLDRNNAVQM
jgi:hypothetical protein